ncbi:MAG: CpaF family protein [Candidatus Omnitrophica bacterium]|nr:CpaF family protein [Candidatus Omnitrophota bacterium]MBI3083217.1 CpaF family protein [Candidatus Omnitrophota bacterium]
MDLQTLNDPQKAKQLREQTAQVTLELLAEEGGFVAGREQRLQLVKEIVDDALGLGPLEDFMADPEISDILVNAKDQVYIEKRGKLFLTGRKFLSNEQLLTVIERIVAPLGRRIDESTPMVDARLPDGSRVNAIIPPLSIKGPMLSIRKFSRERYTMEDLIAFGTLSRAMAEFLDICVKARKNIIVSGGTGSGKTTVLNVLSSPVPKDERIITIEDAAELRLDQEHWIPLESRQANVEGKGAITIRQLFRNTLRMRPDRIIIGECRGEETLDMLQAMNTGHDGSLTTLHANSPQDVIARLDSLVLMGNVDLPVRAIREQIASAIHLIVHTARFTDGSRKITHITEVTGMDERADILFRNLFVFHQQGVGPKGEAVGLFKPTGQPPTFLEELKAKGFSVDESVFSPKSEVRSPKSSVDGGDPEPHAPDSGS